MRNTAYYKPINLACHHLHFSLAPFDAAFFEPTEAVYLRKCDMLFKSKPLEKNISYNVAEIFNMADSRVILFIRTLIIFLQLYTRWCIERNYIYFVKGLWIGKIM